MHRHWIQLLLAGLFGAVVCAQAETARLPLAPESLAGPDIFTEAESTIAQAARTAGSAFTPDPRPLPPQVILTLDTAKGTVQKRKGLLFWRGDMLPDQLAPAEMGTLIRKRLQTNGTWKTTRTRKDFMLSSRTNLLPVARTTPQGLLPPMIIETAYHLGTAGTAVATLVLWRTAEEGSPPLAGFVQLQPAPTNLVQALQAILPTFETRLGWAIEIDGLSP